MLHVLPHSFPTRRASDLNKAETAERHGDEQVHIWRRSFDTPQQPMEAGSAYDLSQDRRYAGIAISATESLKDTIERVLHYWEGRISPEMKAGQRVLMYDRDSSLRALVQYVSDRKRAV